MIIHYIYYCLYAAQMAFRKRKAKASSTISLFSFTLVFYVSSFINLLGLAPTLKNSVPLFPLIILLSCVAVSVLYFGTNNRNAIIISYFEERVGRWNMLHAIMGIAFFFGGTILFQQTASHIHYYDLNDLLIKYKK